MPSGGRAEHAGRIAGGCLPSLEDGLHGTEWTIQMTEDEITLLAAYTSVADCAPQPNDGERKRLESLVARGLMAVDGGSWRTTDEGVRHALQLCAFELYPANTPFMRKAQIKGIEK
jgi:hypothetical protein